MNLSTLKQINEVFGSYKAEWLKERIFDLYTEPTYFPELLTQRPCFLIGGRGTGKTTTLLGLSYEGQFALHKKRPSAPLEWKTYGLFYRVNSNRVSAFDGPELTEDRWKRVFGHYINLILCQKMAAFVLWYSEFDSTFEIPSSACIKLGQSLGFNAAHTIRAIGEQIQNSMLELESYVNNIADETSLELTMLGAPIELFAQILHDHPQMAGKQIFFLIDEYENFQDYQQQVFNTLIKHSTPLYSFKIGVRELGFRNRQTLSNNEPLVHPADYVRLDISEKFAGGNFEQFAEAVCNERLRSIDETGNVRIQDLLPHLSYDNEALLLECDERRPVTTSYNKVVQLAASTPAIDTSKLDPLFCHYLNLLAESRGKPLESVWLDYLSRRKKFATDYNNYKVAILYSIAPRGAETVKYYTGWTVFTDLAAKNIRFLLELVDKSLELHIKAGSTLDEPVCFKNQTKAAKIVAKTNLRELEGLSIDGGRLVKFLISIGRAFNVMAQSPFKYAPEKNQFTLTRMDENSAEQGEAENLLSSGVNQLALVRFRGTKLTESADIRDYEYMIHPIFAPFFDISYRRKRKVKLNARLLLKFVESPREAFDTLLRSGKSSDGSQNTPAQMELFEDFLK